MPPQDPVVMLEGRVDISFSYGQLTPQGALTWSDTWSGESGLPRFVRVIVREPNSGVDLLAEAPFLVRVDAPAACARAAQPQANNGNLGAQANLERRSGQPKAAGAPAGGVGCLAIGPARPAPRPDQGRTSG